MGADRNKSVVAVIDGLTDKVAAKIVGSIQLKKAAIAPKSRGRAAICDTDKKRELLGTSPAKLCDKGGRRNEQEKTIRRH